MYFNFFFILFLLFLVLIMQTTSEKWHFGIGWTSLMHPLRALALPLTAAAGSLVRKPLMVNLVSDPESRISAFKEILGFCPTTPASFFCSLPMLGLTWEVTVIHYKGVWGQHGFHFLSSGFCKHHIPSPLLGCVRQGEAFGLAIVLCVCRLLCLEVTFIEVVHCKAA